MKRFASIILASAALCASAQQYTLQQCINAAISQNLQVKQSQLNVKLQEIQLNTDKNSRLPNLNGSVSQQLSFGRSLTIDNTYANYNTANTGFGLSTSVPIFTGFAINNQVAIDKINLAAASHDLNTIKEALTIQVAKAYMQVLFYKEILQASHAQVELAKKQLDRKKAYLDVQKATIADVADATSLVAQYELTEVQNENNYQLALLELSQLMELSSIDNFSVADIGDDDSYLLVERPEEIYRIALTQKPVIKAAELRIDAADKSIALAKSRYYPQLNFNAGLGTSYFYSSGKQSANFGSQMRDNFNQYLGLSLSIPIFNRLSTRNSVRRAKEEREQKTIALDDAKKSLFKEIQQAYYTALGSAKRFSSSKVALDAATTAFNLTKGKYEAGKANITEYHEASTNLLKATADMLQAKYESIFNHKILAFYKGIPF